MNKSYLILGLIASFAAANIFEEVPHNSAYMTLYKGYSRAIADMGEGVFDFSVALFRSKFFEPHSELFHEFMGDLEPALNRYND